MGIFLLRRPFFIHSSRLDLMAKLMTRGGMLPQRATLTVWSRRTCELVTRSPNLTLLYYFLWGKLRNVVNMDLLYLLYRKIPLLHKAIKYSLLPIKLFTTSWSAPVWMTEPRLASSGNTRLQNKYYQLYADYFIKFLNAYREHGLYFWGITPQNEPIDGWLVNFGFNNLGWTPWEQREFLGYFLGPTLHANGYGNLKVVIVDDQRSFLPFWANIMLQDPKVRQFVSGIAVHWYTDWMSVSPPSLTSDTWGNFKDKFVLYTEACIIPPPGKPAVRLGNWDNAENITLRMIDAFNNMVVGWVDWNIALDEAGGPNWANNVVDALIVVNATSDEFYKQPMFYAMAHFSRFVLPGSKRIEMKSEDPKGIAHVAFRRDDNAIVIILCNSNEEEYSAVITAGLHGNIKLKLVPHSIHTIIFRNGFLG